MEWFRLYDTVSDDPKVQRLNPVLFKHWVNLMCLASQTAPRGTLPCLEDIAFRLRIDEEQTCDVLASLVKAGLLERDKVGVFSPHNWFSRQKPSDDSAPRVAALRAKNKPPLQPQEPEIPVTLHTRYSNAPEKRREEESRQEENREEGECAPVGAAPVCAEREEAKEEKPKTPAAQKRKRFVAPTPEEAKEYFTLKGYPQFSAAFISHYRSNGWRVGKNPMDNWHASADGWIDRQSQFAAQGRASPMGKPPGPTFDQMVAEKAARIEAQRGGAP